MNGSYVKKKFYSSSNPPVVPAETSSAPSLTKQCFAADADINTIMDRYAKTGYMIDPSVNPTRKPQFGDFSDVPTYQEAQQILIDAEEQFSALPSKIRERFENDPVNLLDFMSNPANYEEAVKLGIVEPKVSESSHVSSSNVSESDHLSDQVVS